MLVLWIPRLRFAPLGMTLHRKGCYGFLGFSFVVIAQAKSTIRIIALAVLIHCGIIQWGLWIISNCVVWVIQSSNIPNVIAQAATVVI